MKYVSVADDDPDKAAENAAAALPGLLENFVLIGHTLPFATSAKWREAATRLMILAHDAKAVNDRTGDKIYMAILDVLEVWMPGFAPADVWDIVEAFADLNYEADFTADLEEDAG